MKCLMSFVILSNIRFVRFKRGNLTNKAKNKLKKIVKKNGCGDLFNMNVRIDNSHSNTPMPYTSIIMTKSF